MKIGVISDLHISDGDENQIIDNLTRVGLEKEIDLLLIAGDISEDVYRTIAYVEQLNKSLKTLYVPGNHDLWNRYNKLSTSEIYQLYLNDENCIVNQAYSINDDVEVLGHIGWYDYSLGDTTEYSVQELDEMTIQGRTWNDKNYINWEQSNKQVCNEFDDQLAKLITANHKQKIILTHMISNPGFKVLFDETRKNKGFFNSFLGSDKLYQLTKDKRVTHAVSGHVHYRKTICDNQTEYICPCLGSKNEWKRYDKSIDSYSQIEKCIQVINVDSD